MNIDIQSLGFPITAALAQHAKRRLQFVLTRRSECIQRVVMRVGDENGPRGGVDKFCRIQVYLIDAPLAAVEDIGCDLYAVIDRATDRVHRVVVKLLDRSRTGRRQAADAPKLQHAELDDLLHSTNFDGETPTTRW